MPLLAIVVRKSSTYFNLFKIVIPSSLSELSWLFLKGNNNEFPYGLYLVKRLSPFALFRNFSEGKALSQCTEAIFLFNGSCDSNLNLCSPRNTFQMFTYCLIPDRQSGKKNRWGVTPESYTALYCLKGRDWTDLSSSLPFLSWGKKLLCSSGFYQQSNKSFFYIYMYIKKSYNI